MRGYLLSELLEVQQHRRPSTQCRLFHEGGKTRGLTLGSLWSDHLTAWMP